MGDYPMWEYKICRDTLYNENWLNRLGVERWEMVAAVGTTTIYKRRIRHGRRIRRRLRKANDK